jgi:mannose-6-phosphate isomerase-like protein (cupin superfamily)
MGVSEAQQDFEQTMRKGDAVFIPAGTWHNVVNTGVIALKVSSVYAPPNHPKGTVHRTKEEADRAEE